jgi:hypothetical protein
MNYVSISGLIFNTIGAVLLAFALNRTTKMLDTSITALEHFKDTYLGGGDVLSITGMEIHRAKALKRSKCLTTIGLLLLIIGFLLQIMSFLGEYF